MREIIKGSLLASLLLLLSCCSFASTHVQSELEKIALKNQIHLSPTWEALLHSVDGSTPIKDPAFILSINEFTLKNELIETIRLFKKHPESSCNFPARRQFILSALKLSEDKIETPICAEYLTFKAKAPATNISLIYATENISQPSSMMGHIMLKIDGINDLNIPVEHGISYFTELNSLNVPVIMWESLISGKDGYFQVSPFHKILNHYLKTEQRNVWEFKIDLSDEQSELFHNHLWELKKTKLKYFFNSYNCATFTKMLLRVGRPDKITINNDWLSPIDIVKSASKSGIIVSSDFNPSDKWQLRMLSNAVNSATADNVMEFVDSGEKIVINLDDKKNTYLASLLGKTYNQYKFSNEKYDLKKWKSVNAAIDEFIPIKDNEYSLDLSKFKSPLKTPDDSQVSIGHKYFNHLHWVNFKYLPASHSMEDDNRQFFNENELKLMELSLLSNLDTGKLKIDSLTFYSAKSYIPWNQFTGGVSGHFSISAEQHWDDKLSPSLVGSIYGGAGYTFSLTKDINTYTMLNLGLAGSEYGGYLYAEPEFGFYLYEIFDMKTFFSFKKIYNQRKSKYEQNLISIKHSVLNLNKWSIFIEHERRWNESHSEVQYGLHIKYQY
ncbi:MAG: hypothetical protein ACJAW8_002323 [Oleispira sp.]|jgi:hypothetical protein